VLRLALSSKPEVHTVGCSFNELTSATDGWHLSNILGEGGYGKVYKGQLHTKDGPQVM
jgi:hypothetical protein